jgi:hypothetical protein
MSRGRKLGLLACGLLLALAAVLLQSCSGEATPNCPTGSSLNSEEWNEGRALLEESVSLADSGDGKAATGLFFATGHDLAHRATVAACASDYEAAESLSRALDDFHFEYDPDDAPRMKALLSNVLDMYLSAARAAGVSMVP